VRLAPTPHQLEVLEAYILAGSQKAAANALGMALPTVKNTLSDLYTKLDVTSEMGAALVLGWVQIPKGPTACGWVGYCSRPAGHRGHHGGFRSHP
jgi:hypothetical protein